MLAGGCAGSAPSTDDGEGPLQAGRQGLILVLGPAVVLDGGRRPDLRFHLEEAARPDRLSHRCGLNILVAQGQEKSATGTAVDEATDARNVNPDACYADSDQRANVDGEVPSEHATGRRQILDGNINHEAVPISHRARTPDADAGCSLDRGFGIVAHRLRITGPSYRIDNRQRR